VAAEAPERSPLRLAGRIAAALIGFAFVALLAYGLVTKSPDRTVDDGLRKSGSVSAPALNQPVLERGDLGEPLRSRVGSAFARRSVSLARLRGTPVVLNFWASWCNPCREEFPLLRATYANAAGKWQLVGVNTADLIETDARTFARKARADWPNAYDPDAGVRDGYSAVRGLPQTVFIDSQGIVRKHLYGPLTRDVLDKQLAEIGAT
jgi:cytochrome c biogenesis protein CcmG, thiol:disulfide interchange protein DsbE